MVGPFLKAAASTGSRVYFVHGNWDARDTVVPPGVVTLHSRRDRLGALVIGGLGGSIPTPFASPFEMSEDESRRILEGLGRLEVLVSHCPPAQTKCDRASTGHIGSRAVREYVERARPRLVLTAHVHEGRGIDRLGESVIVNPGALLDGNFAVLHLEGIISVELKNAWRGSEEEPR